MCAQTTVPWTLCAIGSVLPGARRWEDHFVNKKIILKLSFVLYWKLYYCSKNSWGLLKIILCWPYLGQKVEPNQKKEALEPIGSSGGASGEWCAATTAAAAPPWPAVLASRCSSSARAALTWPSFNSELTLYYCLCLQYHKRDCSHPYISLCANEYKASYLTPYFSNSKWSIFSSKVFKELLGLTFNVRCCSKILHQWEFQIDIENLTLK